MHTHVIRSEAKTRTLVRQIAKFAHFVRTWLHIWRHNLMTWHDINLKFSQYVSNWSPRGYSKFRGDPPRFTRVICEKPIVGPFDPLQVRGLMNTRSFLVMHTVTHECFLLKRLLSYLIIFLNPNDGDVLFAGGCHFISLVCTFCSSRGHDKWMSFFRLGQWCQAKNVHGPVRSVTFSPYLGKSEYWVQTLPRPISI